MDQTMLNASGYKDPTAYSAIKSISQGEVFPGDVFIMNINGEDKEVLILAYYPDHVIDTLLVDRMTGKNIVSVNVKGKGKRWLDPSRLTSISQNRLGDYVDTISDDAINKVLAEVGKSMKIPQKLDEDQVRIHELNSRIESMKSELEETQARLEKALDRVLQAETALAESEKHPSAMPVVDKAKLIESEVEIIKIKAERDAWKELYMKEVCA